MQTMGILRLAVISGALAGLPVESIAAVFLYFVLESFSAHPMAANPEFRI
jgi:hypothetical protein